MFSCPKWLLPFEFPGRVATELSLSLEILKTKYLSSLEKNLFHNEKIPS